VAPFKKHSPAKFSEAGAALVHIASSNVSAKCGWLGTTTVSDSVMDGVYAVADTVEANVRSPASIASTGSQV
jgi:hypothetical protein